MARRIRIRELAVWANGVPVGAWRWPARGPTEFQYDDEWLAAPEARPLSLSLPLTLDSTPLRGVAVEAYFDNLLPDSDAIRRRLQDRFHTDSRGAFDLLTAIGRDCVGAVQILPAGESPTDTRKIDATPLSETAIAAELFGVTSPASAALDDSDFRISIAGAQEKTAFIKHQGRWCRPQGSTPTTHIFKLPLGLVGNRQADMRNSVENEWLCARIFRAFGIPIASCEIDTFGAQKVLIVERFDRQLHSSGKYWLRFMQEDFCQATGTPHRRKYQADGGPGVLELGRILRGSVEAEKDLRTLFRSQLLFYLLAATDGHAKNFSLRIHAGGRFQLTPLYDVLSAWPVIGPRANELHLQKVKLAMAVPGERPHYLLKGIQRRHFESLGRKLGLGEETTLLIDELLNRAPAVATEVQRGIPRGFPQALLHSICSCLEKTARALA